MKRIHLLMGFPFSGKSTFAKRFQLPHIEVDEVRYALTGTYAPSDDSSPLVADVVYQSAEHYMKKEQEVMVEGMFLTAQSRKLFTDLAKRYGFEVYVYWFDPSLPWLKEQIQTKQTKKHHISLSYLEWIRRGFEFPTVDEGFQRLYYFSEKDF